LTGTKRIFISNERDPNASGKSNALEAIRLLSLLSKGTRLDDIERGIHGAGTLLRGEPTNLFRENRKGVWDRMPDGWH
jgi:hypothetical protein